MSEPTAIGTRRVLVTGGGSGIGRAVAEHLLRAGARVAIAGRRRERLEALASRWPGRVEVLPTDLARPEEAASLLGRAAEGLGGVDGLVCAAGIARHQRPGAIEEEALRAQLEVNLVAPLRLGEAALEILEPGGGVVFVASNLAHRPLLTSAAYSASKAGLLAAMRALALAGVERGIRYSAVSPGIVDTEMVRELRPEKGEPLPSEKEAARRIEAQLEALRAAVPLGRLGRPEEIAEAIVFLLAAPWATGQELILDGGGLL